MNVNFVFFFTAVLIIFLITIAAYTNYHFSE